MTVNEMYEMAKKVWEENQDKFNYIGIRYENKVYGIGEELEWSKHNPDREDEREFPEFGSKEYEGLPTLRGTSAWIINDEESYKQAPASWGERDASSVHMADHAYIIGGKYHNTHSDADHGEVVIEDAVVLAVLF